MALKEWGMEQAEKVGSEVKKAAARVKGMAAKGTGAAAQTPPVGTGAAATPATGQVLPSFLKRATKAAPELMMGAHEAVQTTQAALDPRVDWGTTALRGAEGLARTLTTGVGAALGARGGLAGMTAGAAAGAAAPEMAEQAVKTFGNRPLAQLPSGRTAEIQDSPELRGARISEDPSSGWKELFSDFGPFTRPPANVMPAGLDSQGRVISPDPGMRQATDALRARIVPPALGVGVPGAGGQSGSPATPAKLSALDQATRDIRKGELSFDEAKAGTGTITSPRGTIVLGAQRLADQRANQEGNVSLSNRRLLGLANPGVAGIDDSNYLSNIVAAKRGLAERSTRVAEVGALTARAKLDSDVAQQLKEDRAKAVKDMMEGADKPWFYDAVDPKATSEVQKNQLSKAKSEWLSFVRATNPMTGQPAAKGEDGFKTLADLRVDDPQAADAAERQLELAFIVRQRAGKSRGMLGKNLPEGVVEPTAGQKKGSVTFGDVMRGAKVTDALKGLIPGTLFDVPRVSFGEGGLQQSRAVKDIVGDDLELRQYLMERNPELFNIQPPKR